MVGRAGLALAGAAMFAALAPALAAGDPGIERLALCRDSWRDWRTSDSARLTRFVDGFRAQFTPGADGTFFIPKTPLSIAGLRVTQVFPQSVGMGVGFSATLDAPFETARKAVEAALGKPLGACETSDGMRSCELQIADQRTMMLMASDSPGSTKTLVGCYYLYEK